jgi:23S rRNA pseudouridine2605 synthase
LLARAGVASRREIERMIAEGRIAINGTVVATPATLIESLSGVTVDGKPVNPPAPARLFRYHKPAGLLTTERDPKGRPTIYDRLPNGLPRVMPVGRLDLNTEGLLLLTTDGELKRALELPRTGANAWIELTLAEGKNREVRRVLEHLSLRVSRLIRTAYGPFALGDLPAGAVD